MEGQNLSAVHGAGLNLSTLMPEAWRAVGLEALQAADVADIPRAQSLLAEATRRATANGCQLLHLAAVQFQCGLASEAVETLEKAKVSALDQVSAQERLHGWRHLAQVDAVAPVLTWADSHPEDAPPLLKELTLRAQLVAKMRLSSDLWTLGSVYVPGGTSERSVRVQQTTDGDLGAAWYEINRLRSHSARSADFLVICRTLLTLRWLEGNLAPTTSRSS